MTEKERQHIRDTIKWYDETEGSEKEFAADEMREILCNILKTNQKKKQ